MYLLPDALKRLREVAPGIEVEVVASNDVRDLRRREADIAIRHGRPEQPDLIAKLLRETSIHLYASSDYLDQHGRPTSPSDLSEAVFIGFDQSDRLLTRLNEIGLTLTKNNFKLISESGAVAWELVKQGLGIGLMVKEVGDRTAGVECVLPDLDPITVPIWLVTHRELHTSRRIRLVFDLLAASLK
jgi:DNA-binding transcriptional LysR family regulator